MAQQVDTCSLPGVLLALHRAHPTGSPVLMVPSPGFGVFFSLGSLGAAPQALTQQGPRNSARHIVEGFFLCRYKRPCVFRESVSAWDQSLESLGHLVAPG